MGRAYVVHAEETKAAAIELYLKGKSSREIGRTLAVSGRTVREWVRHLDPARNLARATYERTREELGNLVYDSVVETLKSITARARATGDPDWIRGQNADALAALDAAQWDRIIRVIASFKPADGEPAPELDEPEPHRNGAVDPAS
jgi:transposase-like protein